MRDGNDELNRLCLGKATGEYLCELGARDWFGEYLRLKDAVDTQRANEQLDDPFVIWAPFEYESLEAILGRIENLADTFREVALTYQARGNL